MKTLAECLLRRKELQQKLDKMEPIKAPHLFEVKVQRKPVSESIDEMTLSIPKMEYHQFVAEYNHVAKQLRLIDALIQRTNWNTQITDADECFVDYEDKK